MTDQITTKPGKKYASIKHPRVYEALRKRGYSKESAARISNAQKAYTLDDLEVAALKDHDPLRAVIIAAQLSPIALKGEQIAPGITRIRGNLCNVHGRYGPCDGAVGGKRKPAKGRKPRAARKPIKTPEQRQAARQVQHEQNRAKVLEGLGIDTGAQAALAALRQGKQPDPAALARAGLVGAGLVERAADGSFRMSPAGRALMAAADAGDAGRAGDTISGARDKLSAHEAKRQAAAQKKVEADAKKRAAAAKPKKAASGGGNKQPASRTNHTAERAAQRAVEREQHRAEIADTSGLGSAAGALFDFADGGSLDPNQANGLLSAGLVAQDSSGNYRVTPTGHVFVHAADRGDAGSARDALSRARDQVVQQQQQRDRAAQREADRKQRAADRQTKQLPRQTLRGPQRSRRAPILMPLRAHGHRQKALSVFKDAAGEWRWIARTTTAFEDRDHEVISTKALEADVARADADGRYGPLRWWHMGRPNPLDPGAPWGPGVDLGWCDFNALSGKTLIESGTFVSEEVAQAVAAKADDLELSPGFFHAAAEPDRSGVFDHIHRFERSLVPKWAGRASNLYTGLIVQGKAMDAKKVEALKALGVPDDTVASLIATVEQTEKAAEADGVRYKDANPIKDFFVSLLRGEQMTTKEEAAPVVADAVAGAEPDPVLVRIKALEEEIAALKAGPPQTDQGAGAMDAEDMADQGADEGAEGEPPLDASDDTGGGLTLAPEDLQAIGSVISELLQPLIGALGITQKLEGHLGELKTMMGGYTKQKDDAEAERQGQIAALKAQIDQQQAALAELTGDQPRVGYRPSQATDNVWQNPQVQAAMKDNLDNGGGADFSDIAAQLFPGLVQR